MLYRILTLRRHKTVTFCDAYSFDEYRQQLVFYHDKLDCSGLVSGCTADLTCHPGKNNRGMDVLYVDAIHHVFLPENSSHYKGFQKEAEEPALNALAQDLNGGVHLRQYRFRLEFLRELRALLAGQGIFETNTPTTTPYRGTSVAAPVQATGRYTGQRYIKITHELGLKTQCYLSLAPVYEMGYVMRDRYVTKSGLNEFLTLEAVIPCDRAFDLAGFYRQILEMSRRLAGELGLEYDPVFDQMAVIDVAEVFAASQAPFSPEAYDACYERILRENPHCIVCNAPLDSPLGAAGKNGLVTETKWVLDGHGFGHGYRDEYRVEVLRQTFRQQQEKLAGLGIQADLPEDYLTVCAYAGIPTFSFNLGIDRYLGCFFGEKLE